MGSFPFHDKVVCPNQDSRLIELDVHDIESASKFLEREIVVSSLEFEAKDRGVHRRASSSR